MKRLVEDPTIRHRLTPEEFKDGLALVETITLGGQGKLRITAADGTEAIVPSGIADAWLDVASLLVGRSNATLMVVDENQEYGPADAADILGISPSKASAAMDEGKLGGRRVGSNRRISMASIVAQQSARAVSPQKGGGGLVPLTVPLQPTELVDESRWDDGRVGGHLKKPNTAPD